MNYLTIGIKTILITLIVLPLLAYGYNKTIGKGITDCMIEYVNGSYPNGCSYTIFGEYRHIDKCGIGNELMIEEEKVNGCIFEGVINNIFNMPYCYVTLILEK